MNIQNGRPAQIVHRNTTRREIPGRVKVTPGGKVNSPERINTKKPRQHVAQSMS